MDRSRDNSHSDVDDADNASESEHSDGNDVSENGDPQGDPTRLSEDRSGDPGDDPEEEDDDDDDSDVETQRIGTSVLRFARRCVKTGEFAKAMAALLNVVEISELDAVPCRQALLFAAQVFTITGQETRALECMLELWDNMPPPYTRQDAQLLLAVIYERLEQPRASAYWFKKAFGSSEVVLPSTDDALSVWLSLAERSYDEGDLILSTEAYSRAFGCIFQTQRWPADLLIFRFVARFLTALVSVAQLRPDRQSYRQQIAFSLAITLLDSDAIDSVPLAERAFDCEYLALRRVYAASFPSIYAYLFKDEDRFVGRIARAWRVWRARRERKRAIAERERQKREAALAAMAARAANAKKKQKKKKPPGSPKRSDDESEDDQMRRLRQRTKARVESLRTAQKKKKKNASPPKPLRVPEHAVQPVEAVTSPTRRKLETVKRLRNTSAMELSEETHNDQESPIMPTGNQRPTSCERSPSRAASLLDVYEFPQLGSQRRAFEADAGRPQGPADIEDAALEEIEAFARMAHYRSRVLVQRHTSIQDVGRLERVTPQWLRRFQYVVSMVEAHEQHQPVAAHASHYFSEIHARVVSQLTHVYTQYMLQHGKTAFTIQLARLLRRLESWQFTSVAHELIPAMRQVQALGEREEAHRNLEFFHAQQQQQQQHT